MGKVYTHVQTERVQKPSPLWWLRAAWGGSTSGGLPSWKAALNVSGQKVVYIENTSWKVLAYGIYARVVDVSEIERVSAANE